MIDVDKYYQELLEKGHSWDKCNLHCCGEWDELPVCKCSPEFNVCICRFEDEFHG